MESNEDRCDVLVVGAGFAGLTCARAAAALGLRTLVLERKHDPGAACRTTGILVKEAAEELEIPPNLVRRVSGARLYGPSLVTLDLVSPAYYFLATDTPGLLRWLSREAGAAGAVLRLGEVFCGATRRDGRFHLENVGLSARFLVGADGVRSAVGRSLGIQPGRSFLTGVEAELEGVRGVDPDRLHCFLDSRFAPGYIGWVVPGMGITQVGVACPADRRPRLDLFLERVRRIFDFRQARLVGHRGGLIPVGGSLRSFGATGAALVGDSAEMVSPLTGGGIHNALRLGRLTGRAVAEHLLHGGPEPHRVLEDIAPRYRWKRLLRLVHGWAPPNWLFNLALASPPFRALARAVFLHNRELLSYAAWRELLIPADER